MFIEILSKKKWKLVVWKDFSNIYNFYLLNLIIVVLSYSHSLINKRIKSIDSKELNGRGNTRYLD